MKNIDVSAMIVSYNFVVGVLLMLSSEKVGTLAGVANKAYRTTIIRLTHVSIFTIGACWAALSGSIYVLWHLLRIWI
jgi:hypothetical protein